MKTNTKPTIGTTTTEKKFNYDEPKYSGWFCEYGDMQIFRASQKEVDEHMKTHVNNQTTTEAKVRKILTVNGMLDLEQVDEIMQLIAQEKKSLLEEVEKDILEGNHVEPLPGIEIMPYLWAERNARNYLRAEQRKKLKALAHSQEDREGK